MVADEVAEMVGAAGVAAFLDHAVEAAGGEAGEFLQGLTDEREVRVDARRA